MRFLRFTVVSVLLVSDVANAVIIDDFRHGALDLEAVNYRPGASHIQTNLPSTSTIGGQRHVHVGSLDGPTSLEIDPAEGRLTLSRTESISYFTLSYGAETHLKLNLLAGGDTAFVLSFAAAPDSGDYRFELRAGSAASYYDFSKEVSALEGPGDITIPFSKFAGIPLTSIGRIDIDGSRISRAPQAMVLHGIRTVPEPSTAVVALLGAGALLGRRMRRRQTLACSAPYRLR